MTTATLERYVRVTALYFDDAHKSCRAKGAWVVCVMVGTGYVERHRFHEEADAEEFAAGFADDRKVKTTTA